MTKWEKLGKFIGYLLATTMAICAEVIVVAFTLEIVWLILFQGLL